MYLPTHKLITSLSLSLSPHPPPNNRGVWNVPFITAAVLICGKLLTQLKDDLPSYHNEEFDPDMAFAAWMRERVCTCYSLSAQCLTYCKFSFELFYIYVSLEGLFKFC